MSEERLQEVIMPQMGKSIEEGTVTKWLVKIGAKIERDQPLLGISTHKVDAEIPSPVRGQLTEVLVAEGDTIPVGTLLGRITTRDPLAATEPLRLPVAAKSYDLESRGANLWWFIALFLSGLSFAASVLEDISVTLDLVEGNFETSGIFFSFLLLMAVFKSKRCAK